MSKKSYRDFAIPIIIFTLFGISLHFWDKAFNTPQKVIVKTFNRVTDPFKGLGEYTGTLVVNGKEIKFIDTVCKLGFGDTVIVLRKNIVP